MSEEYWLEQWVREFDIQSAADYRRAIQSPTVIKSLFSKIPQKGLAEDDKPALSDNMVMAGRGLDLSASFHHHCFSCLKKELSSVVTRTAHYFQRVAVSGPVTSILLTDLQSKDKTRRERTLRDLQAHVTLLLYINEIDARDRVTFLNKPSKYCQSCYLTFAREAGFDVINNKERSQEVIAKLVETSSFHTVRNRAGHWEARVWGPMVTRSIWSKDYGRSRPTRKKIASDLFGFLAQPALQDFSAAKHYKLPIVDTFDISWLEQTSETNTTVSAQDVALHVNLPAIVGLDLQEFLRLQREESDSYIKFQNAVRTAVREALDRHQSKAASEIARAVTNEYITPEIADIERKLKASTRSLSKKVGATVAVAATVTSIGLIAAMPLVITAGIAAAGTWLPQLHKYFDDKAAVETSDMYFLWKLGKIRHD